MPKPKIGDVVRWTDNSVWRITSIGPGVDYVWEGKGICVETRSENDVVGEVWSVVFVRDTVEDSGWVYAETDFQRFVREVLDEASRSV